MFFTAAFALAAASLAMAQDVTINSASLTQCAQSTLNFVGSAESYYVAVLPASDPCANDALAEFYDVTTQSVDYYVNIPQGTEVQLYVVDSNGGEFWGPVMSVGEGDASCLNGSDAAVETPEAETPSSSAAPTTYIPPNANAAATTPAAMTYSGNSNSGNSGNVVDNSDDVPVNAVNETNGASALTASATLIFGAFAAVVALF